MKEKLYNLIIDMDVPEFRRRDVKWLNRNLGVRNHNHPNYPAAVSLIRDILQSKTE